MAKIAKPPIPIKMYRHFAIITLAITALMAFFADGEGREELADQIAENHEEIQQRNADDRRERDNNPQLAVRDRVAPTSFNASDSEDFGRASVRLTPSRHGGIGATSANAAQPRPGERSLPGYTTGYLNTLTEEQYERLEQSLRETGMLDPAQRRANIREMERQSSLRSGRATQMEDTAL